MTGAAKPDDKAPCDCSGRFRNAQWQTLICCLLSKIAQMPHLAGRETLRHLFAGHFLRTALWTCKLGEPGISPSQPPTSPFALSGDPESALGPAGEHWAPGDLELGTRGALTPGHRLQALRAPESCPAACQGPGQPSQLAGREGCEQSRQRSHQKISLAPSLAGSGCQCMQEEGWHDAAWAIPGAWVTAGSPASSLICYKLHCSCGSDVQALAGQLPGLQGGFCTRDMRGVTTSGF